jgi:hypothetical protein
MCLCRASRGTNTVKPFQEIALFVVGLEKSLEKYIRTGYGGEGDYYNLDEIPPILSHLNWQRENFRDRFRHLCFVFLSPSFAIKYISRRAPDFFDWGSGIFEIQDREILETQQSGWERRTFTFIKRLFNSTVILGVILLIPSRYISTTILLFISIFNIQ